MTEDKKEAVREAMRNLDSESVSLLKHLVEVQNGLDDRMGRFRHKLNVCVALYPSDSVLSRSELFSIQTGIPQVDPSRIQNQESSCRQSCQ
jgi:hypothetical protein